MTEGEIYRAKLIDASLSDLNPLAAAINRAFNAGNTWGEVAKSAREERYSLTRPEFAPTTTPSPSDALDAYINDAVDKRVQQYIDQQQAPSSDAESAGLVYFTDVVDDPSLFYDYSGADAEGPSMQSNLEKYLVHALIPLFSRSKNNIQS
jgi:hypothetical protein